MRTKSAFFSILSKSRSRQIDRASMGTYGLGGMCGPSRSLLIRVCLLARLSCSSVIQYRVDISFGHVHSMNEYTSLHFWLQWDVGVGVGVGVVGGGTSWSCSCATCHMYRCRSAFVMRSADR